MMAQAHGWQTVSAFISIEPFDKFPQQMRRAEVAVDQQLHSQFDRRMAARLGMLAEV
jgi:hypothetical protein